MRILLAAISSMALMLSSAVQADDAKAPPPTPASDTKADSLICHPMMHDGVIMHKSECHTQKEWDQIQFHQQEEFREFQMRSLTNNPH